MLMATSGCQSLQYWWRNGKRVGPNYVQPNAMLADNFTSANPAMIDHSSCVATSWWQVFNDPDLNILIDTMREQNLTLKAACHRIKEARHQRNIAAANLFPQSQQATGSYVHAQSSRNSPNFFPGLPLTTDSWSKGFDIGWELDLWGRIRRSVEAADANVETAVHDRDFAMVSLIAETASLYINIRAFDERIELAQKNVELQQGSLRIAKTRFKEGRTSKLDVTQAESNLASTRSLIPQLELGRRQALNALAVLLGVPPSSVPFLSDAPGAIPQVPPQVVIGIPGELLTRRPDVMAAERTMKAQFEQIGIAEAELYPTFSIGGTLGWQAAKLSDLIEGDSFNGSFAPAFRWNILNYGRLENAICVQRARFDQIKLDFQNTVLDAQREVEDGIVEFVKRNEQYEFDLATTEANEEAVELAIASFKEGKTDFGRVFVVQTNLVTAQDRLVATRASIALALVNTYRALGGGWEVCNTNQTAQMDFLPTSAELPLSTYPTDVEMALPAEPINANALKEQ